MLQFNLPKCSDYQQFKAADDEELSNILHLDFSYQCLDIDYIIHRIKECQSLQSINLSNTELGKLRCRTFSILLRAFEGLQKFEGFDLSSNQLCSSKQRILKNFVEQQHKIKSVGLDNNPDVVYKGMIRDILEERWQATHKSLRTLRCR